MVAARVVVKVMLMAAALVACSDSGTVDKLVYLTVAEMAVVLDSCLAVATAET